jgi:hypothetical protein
MRADLILVTGATGNTGSAVLQQLRERGAHVRAMVRAASDTTRLSEPSVETIVADSDDTKSIDTALRPAGPTSAYPTSTPQHDLPHLTKGSRAGGLDESRSHSAEPCTGNRRGSHAQESAPIGIDRFLHLLNPRTTRHDSCSSPSPRTMPT